MKEIKKDLNKWKGMEWKMSVILKLIHRFASNSYQNHRNNFVAIDKIILNFV